MCNISSRLLEERNKLKLNQLDMAEAGGVSKRAQGYYESGERVPDGNYFCAIAKAGADVQYILTGKRSDRLPEGATLTLRQIASRLPALLEAMGGEDVRDWAADLEEDYRRLEFILAGELPLPADLLKKLVDADFDANWLLTGTGRMHRVPPELVDKRLREYEPISKRERSLLDEYRVCDGEDQDALYRVSKSLAEKHRKD